MTCRRAIEADLLALVHGESDAALQAHVDGCADCSAELEVWRELDALLQAGAGGPGAHPGPEALVALVDAPASLASDARAAVERHVADCRVCADEVRGLRAFAPDAIGAAAKPLGAGGHADRADVAARGPASAPRGGRTAVAAARRADAGTPASGPRRGLGSVLWHPAFAYALVVLLLLPLVRAQLPKLSYETRAVDARRDEPALPPAAPAERPRQERTDEQRMRRAPAAPPVAAPPPAGAPPAVAAAPGRPSIPGAVRQAPPAAGRVAANEGREADRGLADETVPPLAEGAFAKRGAPVPDDRQQRLAADAALPPSTDRDAGQGGATVAGSDRGEKAAAPRLASPPETGGAAREPMADESSGLPQAAPAAPAGAVAAAPLVLNVEPGRPTIFGADAIGRPVLLRVTPPADLPGGNLTVTVRARAGSRALVSLGINDATAIGIAIPSDWLAPGDYVVTLQPVVDGLKPAGAPALLGFSVRAPTAR